MRDNPGLPDTDRGEIQPRSLSPFVRCLVALLLAAACQAVAGGTDPNVEVAAKENPTFVPTIVSNWIRPFPQLQIYTQFHSGYDDNFRTTQSAEGAWFTDEQVTLSYHLPSRDTQLSIVAGGGATNYLEERNDAHGFLDLSFARAITHRLTLNASVDARYQSEPDLNTNVGPNRFNGSFFSMTDRIWADYKLTRRLSAVSSYNLELVRYDDQTTAAFTDREEHTLGEQLRFDLTGTTVLTGEYRLLFVDYVTVPRDSTTDFLLAGIEHRFNPRLRAQFRAGVSLRSYDAGGSQSNPDFEGSLDYAITRRTSLSWTGSYAVEEPAEQDVTTRTTFRSGLQLSHYFTGRLSSSLGFNYSHNENQQGTTPALSGPSFAEDIFDLSLGVHYQFSSLLNFDATFDHSELSSGQPLRSYSRNRYSIGFSFAF